MAAIPSSGVPIAAGHASDETTIVVAQAQNEALTKITEASAGIIERGFDAAMFTTDAVYGAGFTTEQYLKLAKQFTRHEDLQIKGPLLGLGIRNNLFYTPDGATFGDVVDFLKYLSSPAGQQAQHFQQQKAKLLLLHNFGEDKVVQDAAVQIFMPQLNDFTFAQIRLNRGHDPGIAKLRAQLARVLRDVAEMYKLVIDQHSLQKKYDTIAKLRAQLASSEHYKEKELTTLQDVYRPASLFREPSEEELNLDCYAMYEEEGIKSGKVVLPRGDAGYAEACKLYAGMVLESRMAIFANEERNKKQLLEYTRRKILQLKSQVGQSNAAEDLQSILDSAEKGKRKRAKGN